MINQNQENNKLWRVTIDSPDSGFFAGTGLTYALALEAAEKQANLSKLPKKGPGMWEMNKKP